MLDIFMSLGSSFAEEHGNGLGEVLLGFYFCLVQIDVT